MNRIGVYYSPSPEAQALAQEIRDWLARRVEVWAAPVWEEESSRHQVPTTDLVLCVGGDGTVLRAARAVHPHPVPILGIKVGRLGFLAELTPAEVWVKLKEILEGGGRIEERAMLKARPLGAASGAEYYALNDVVLGRGASGKLVQVAVRVDETPLAVYRADGVIVATATGSTAYSLAAGGPVLFPESRGMVLTPVAPHLAAARSVVLPPAAAVELRLEGEPRAILTIDGQVVGEVGVGEGVQVRASPQGARFLRLDRPADYYRRLGRRLEWLAENRWEAPWEGPDAGPA